MITAIIHLLAFFVAYALGGGALILLAMTVPWAIRMGLEKIRSAKRGPSADERLRAEQVRAHDLEKDNRRLDMENLQLTTRIHNLSRALDVALDAMESVREEKREERREVLRKAFVKRHTDDIERITKDIEEGLRG